MSGAAQVEDRITDVSAEKPDAPPGAPDRARGLGLLALAGRHRVFTAVLAVGVLLRGITMLGYRPAMFFNDSFDYLHAAMDLYPHPLRPDGYSFMLLILRPFHSFALVVAVQHLMGVAMGLMIYALLRRRFGLPGWGAALAAAPVLLDAYQIQLEHLILSDAPFTFLLVSAITLVLWHARPSWRVAVAIGLLLGMASLTRTLGLPVLLAVVGFMVLRRMRWRVIALTLVSGVLPLIAYSGWFYSEHEVFNTTESNGIFLYARVYKFADCAKIKPPVDEIPFCVQAENRLPNSQDGIWNRRSPLRRFPEARFSSDQNARASSFSQRAILAQPGDYLQVVAYDFFRVFRWERTVFPDPDTYSQYEFEKKSNPLPEWRMSSDTTAAQEAMAYERGNAGTRVVEPFAGVIRTYQDHFYLRGSLLGIILLIALAGMVPLWRRFGGPALLPVVTAIGLLLAPAATAEFDYRYVLPTVPLVCLAAALAFGADARGRFTTAFRRRRATADEAPAAPADDERPEPELAALR